MPRIFISYRRDDSKAIAYRLYDRLEPAFGADNLFLDVDRIPPGEDFRSYLQNAIAEADVVLVVIGPKWASIIKQRLEDPNDFVRMELETAIEQSKVTIPVLVDGTKMPAVDDLPPSIAQVFAYKNAVSLGDDPNFHRDVDRLIKALKPPPLPANDDADSSKSRWLIGLLALLIVILLGLLVLLQIFPNNKPTLTQTAVAQITEPSLTLTTVPSADPIVITATPINTCLPPTSSVSSQASPAQTPQFLSVTAMMETSTATFLHPETAQEYTKRGNGYYNQNELVKALADFNCAIYLSPQYPDAYDGRGNVYYSQNKFDLALSDYSKAISLNPQYAEAHNDRGIVYYHQNKFDLASADYSDAIILNPQYAVAYENLGDLYYMQNNYSKALANYEEYLKLAGDNADPSIKQRVEGLGG